MPASTAPTTPRSRSWGISTPRDEALLAGLFADWKSAPAYTRVPRPAYDVAPATLKIETPDKANASSSRLPLYVGTRTTPPTTPRR